MGNSKDDGQMPSDEEFERLMASHREEALRIALEMLGLEIEQGQRADGELLTALADTHRRAAEGETPFSSMQEREEFEKDIFFQCMTIGTTTSNQ